MIKSRSKKIVLLPFIFGGIFLVAIVYYFLTPSLNGSAKPKRDIVLISIDTLRADHLGCYGYSRNTSPFIDQFASESILFENAVTPAPVTAPAHMSIFTALNPSVHKVFLHGKEGGYVPLSEDIVTLPEVLKKHGYETLGFTGGANISGHLGFNRGFNIYSNRDVNWEGAYEKPEELDLIRKSIRSVKEKGAPLFLFLHNYLCHDPYLKAPKELRFRFLETRVEGLPTDPDDLINKQGFAAKRESFWKNVDLNNPAHRDHIISLYDGGILYADYVFGELVKLLKEEGFYDESIIILLSDHGEEFFEHQTYLHSYLFKETMHVPLIIRFPHQEHSGMRISSLVRTQDTMPTVMEILGIDPDFFTQGSSFMPLLTREGKYDPIILSYSAYARKLRFYKDGFVYTNQPAPGGSEWVFDPSDDPRELNNLAATVDAKTLEKMRTTGKKILEADEALADKYERAERVFLRPEDDTIKQLRALGYLQ